MLRDARPDDPGVPELLYLAASGHYDRYFGTRDRAVALVRDAFSRAGNFASAETVRVADLDGRPAGVIAAFPVPELDPRSRRFTRLTLPRIPPWHWRAARATVRTAGELTPPPPEDGWYVDALAVAAWARRAGVARALLVDAEAQARAAGLASVALDTTLDNASARGLYEAVGFAEIGRREGGASAVARIGAPGLVSYVRAL